MRTFEVLSLVVAVALAATMLSACADSAGKSGEVAAAVAPTPVRDVSTPEAALAAIYAEWHEGDVEEACTYFDETFERTFEGDRDCVAIMAEFDEDDFEQMGNVKIDGSKVYYYEDGTAFVPAIAVTWPDGRIYTYGGLYIERKNGWFRTFDPFP